MAALIRNSRPRFRREANRQRVELTSDDIEILRHVYRHRFLRTTQIYRLFPNRSPDKLSRRLAALFRSGHLDRPIAQIDYFRGEGSQPLVYGLDTAGARALAERGHAPRGSDWPTRNRGFTRDNLDHTLGVAEFMVTVELACAARDDVEFLPFEQILGQVPAQTRALAQPGRWPVLLPWHGQNVEVQLAPDGIFGLRYQREGRSLLSYFFVEVDRGAMTIAPSDTVRRSPAFLYRSSVLRKLLAYSVSHQSGLHQAHFGFHASRVLMLTTKAGRAEEMRKAAHELVVEPLTVPPDLFLFGCDFEAPLSVAWRNVEAVPVHLLDSNL